MPNVLQQRVEEVINDLNISPREQKFIKPFIVYGFNMFHAGSTMFKQGAIIGIPINFTYKTVADIESNRLTLAGQQPVDWSRPEAEDLLNALIMSEHAQKFAIACEILKSRNFQVIFNSFSSMIVVGGMYTISHESNKRLKLFKKPLSVRAMLYCLVGLFGFGAWISMKDILTRIYEKSIDEKLSELGPNYVKGGLEFCDKIVKRNIALRALMDKDGQKIFSSTGNELSLWRQKSLQILQRKRFFDMKMQNLEFNI